MKKRYVLVLCMLAFNVDAEVFWTAPLNIQKLDMFYSDEHSHTFLIVKPSSALQKEDGSPIPSTCSVTNTQNIVGHWSQNWALVESGWYATLLNAFNLDLPVQLSLNTGFCGSVTGIRIRGVRLVK